MDYDDYDVEELGLMALPSLNEEESSDGSSSVERISSDDINLNDFKLPTLDSFIQDSQPPTNHVVGEMEMEMLQSGELDIPVEALEKEVESGAEYDPDNGILSSTSADDVLAEMLERSMNAPAENENDYGITVDENGEQDPLYLFDLDEILSDAIDLNASDINIYPHREIHFEVLGIMRPSSYYGKKYMSLDNFLSDKLLEKVTSHQNISMFSKNLDLDTSYTIKRGRHENRRFRVKIGRSNNGTYYVFRTINDFVLLPTDPDMHIPQQVIDWFTLRKGLIMVNGPTGMGKSTTLASLINNYLHTRPLKVCTIEDPVEFVYQTEGIMGFVSQREVGIDVKSFEDGLKAVLRESPKLILLGEARNRNEINQLLRAAKSGHLSVATMHSSSAPTTVDQIKQLFDGSDQASILGTLAEVGQGFVNQMLVTAPDGKSRWAVREVLEFDEEVSDLVKRGDVDGLNAYQFEHGITMEHELFKAYQEGHCTLEEARGNANKKRIFNKIVEMNG